MFEMTTDGRGTIRRHWPSAELPDDDDGADGMDPAEVLDVWQQCETLGGACLRGAAWYAIVEAVENERYVPLLGWTRRLLPTDAGVFTDWDGRRAHPSDRDALARALLHGGPETAAEPVTPWQLAASRRPAKLFFPTPGPAGRRVRAGRAVLQSTVVVFAAWRDFAGLSDVVGARSRRRQAGG